MLKKAVLVIGVSVFILGCGSVSRTAGIPSKEDYDRTIAAKYKSSAPDREFDEGIAVLAKNIVTIMQRNGNGLYDVSIEEFISEREYEPGMSETSAFGRILANRLASEIIQYSDTLERKGSDINIAIEVVKRAAIQRFKWIEDVQKRRIDGSVKIIISGSYYEMSPPIMGIEASVYSSKTALAQAASMIRVPVPSRLRWESTSDQYLYRLH
ncbi:MAG: hypothetical protein JNL74_07895 [Fibrobacteres bacterium]|nr:hypothetical protein [Fibrobacterota bacterium]